MADINIQKHSTGAFLLFRNGLVGLQLKNDLEILVDKWKLATFNSLTEYGETEADALKRVLRQQLGLNLNNHRYEKIVDIEIELQDGITCIEHKYIVYEIDFEDIKLNQTNLFIFDPKTDIFNLRLGRFVKESMKPALEKISNILGCSSETNLKILNTSHKKPRLKTEVNQRENSKA